MVSFDGAANLYLLEPFIFNYLFFMYIIIPVSITRCNLASLSLSLSLSLSQCISFLPPVCFKTNPLPFPPLLKLQA